jgi:hypothetical protein
VKIFFGTFLGGRSATNIHATAIAVAGGPCTENANVLPLVAASCALANSTDGDSLCDQTVTLDFGTGGPATVAFADLTPPSNTLLESEVQQQLSDAAGGTSPDVHVFERVATGDGTGYTAATINQLNSMVGGTPFVVPVINLGMPCSGPIPVRPAPVGFADVTLSNVTWNPGVARTISVVVRCTTQCSGAHCAGATYRPSDQDGGCAHFGFGTQFPPRLVK